MIADFKPYPAMKDSGLEWLGEVPAHWEVRRLKYVLRERDARSVDGTEQLLRVSQYTGVTERKIADKPDELDTRAKSLVGYKRVDPGELAVNIMLAWNGSLGVSAFSGIVSPAYCVYRFGARAQPWYFHYLLRSPIYKARIKAVSTGVVESRLRLYTDNLYRLESLLPSLEEQFAIVRFLDYMDRRIGRAIRAKQKLIKLLNEQKRAIVHRTVTRGLDLDVPLRDSGIDWLGDVPEHWEVKELRRIVAKGRTITYGIVQPGGHIDGGRPMVRAQDYSFGWVAPENVYHVSEAIETPYSRSRLDTGDIVYTIVGQGSVGNVAIVPECFAGANITQTTARISLDRELAEPRYVAAILDGPIGRTQLRRRVKGVGQPGINLGHLRLYQIPLPSVEEQEKIAAFLDDVVARHDAAITCARTEIQLLGAYRTRLVADVVTGKIDVREAAAQLPEEVDDDKPLDDAGDIGAEEEATHAAGAAYEEAEV